mgnify:CR=1 FL=1
MRSGRRWGWVAAVWLGGLGVALAGTNYEASVRAGEAAQRAGHGSAALVEYSAALAQAANTTERALALAKKATVHAYVHQDYAAAQAAARSALDLTNARPVARVTALQVLAECQMKAEGDNVAAAGTLEEALLLPEVDWARPTLLLMLGDAYRLTGQFTMALANLQELQDLPDADTGAKGTGMLNTGFIYQYGLKDPAKARAAYAAAVRLRPDLQAEVARHEAGMAAP